jgi:hypothetical protein
MKQLGERTIIKVQKIYTKQKDGVETMDVSREGKVLETSHPELKKGDIVYYNPRGCVNIEAKDTKKEMVLVVDNDDLYCLID